MKVSPSQLSSLVRNNAQGLISLLFYGDNDSFIQPKIVPFLRQNSILKAVSEKEVLAYPNFLVEKLLTSDFFQATSLYIIKEASDKIVPFLKQSLEHFKTTPPPSYFLVQAANYLGPSSKLRRYYEEESVLASIACYAPSVTEINTTIQNYLHTYLKTIEPQALKSLVTMGETNYATLISVLETLITYVGTKVHLSLEDVHTCRISDGSENVSLICKAFFDRNIQELNKKIQELLSLDNSPITIIRQLSNYALRLFELKNSILQGLTPDQAISGYKPPIVFTERSQIIFHIKTWNMKDLKKVLENLVRLEGEIKNNFPIASDILQHRLSCFTTTF